MSDYQWSFDGEVPSQPPEGSPQPLESSWRQRAVSGRLDVGSSLGDRYRIVSLLGRGGMGVVYRAIDAPSGREVALKVVTRQLNPLQLERFRREGELTAALQHPGIVRIHEAGQLEGIPYLAYELVPGGKSLEDLLANPAAQPKRMAALLAEVAEALGYAHQQGVIHRDIKPSNVLVDESGKPRVADFGLAISETAERMTQSGAMLGTPSFMAPEQISGMRDVGPQADVWSLGVILYQALTRELPFEGETLIALAAAICAGRSRPLRQLAPDVDRALESICLQCLEVDPSRRYATATELAIDLRRALGGESIATSTPARRWARKVVKSTRFRVVATLLAVCLTAGALVLAFGRTQPRPLDEEARVRRLLTSLRAGEQTADQLRNALAQSDAAGGLSGQTRGEVALALAGALELSLPDRLKHASEAVELLGVKQAGATQADLLLELGRSEDGARVLIEAWGESQDPAQLVRLSQVLLESGQLQAADRLVTRLEAEFPAELRGQHLRVRVALAREEWEEARAGVRDLEQRQPSLDVRLLAAEVARATRGDPFPAIRRAAGDAVGERERSEVLGCLIRLGEIREAASWAERWRLPRTAPEELRALWVVLPQLVGREVEPGQLQGLDPNTRAGLLRWALREGRRDVSLAVHPRHPTLHPNYRPSDVGPSQWGARARASLELVASAAPGSRQALEAYVLLAELAQALGPDELAEPVERAVGIDPDAPGVVRAQAWLANHRGQAPLALELARRLPEDGYDRDALEGQALLALGRHTEAARCLTSAFEATRRLDPELGALLQAALEGSKQTQAAAEVETWVGLLRGARRREAWTAYDEARDGMRSSVLEERLEALDQALALDPLLWHGIFLRAKVSARGGSLDSGFRGMVEAVDQQPFLYPREACDALRESRATGLQGAMGGKSLSSLQGLLEDLDAKDRQVDLPVRLFLRAALVEFEGQGRDYAELAIWEAGRLLEARPHGFLARLARGFLHLRLGNLIPAERDLALVTELAPEAGWFYIGLLRAKRGRPERELFEAFQAAAHFGFAPVPVRELEIYPELEGRLSPSLIADLRDKLSWN